MLTSKQKATGAGPANCKPCILVVDREDPLAHNPALGVHQLLAIQIAVQDALEARESGDVERSLRTLGVKDLPRKPVYLEALRVKVREVVDDCLLLRLGLFVVIRRPVEPLIAITRIRNEPVTLRVQARSDLINLFVALRNKTLIEQLVRRTPGAPGFTRLLVRVVRVHLVAKAVALAVHLFECVWIEANGVLRLVRALHVLRTSIHGAGRELRRFRAFRLEEARAECEAGQLFFHLCLEGRRVADVDSPRIAGDDQVVESFCYGVGTGEGVSDFDGACGGGWSGHGGLRRARALAGAAATENCLDDGSGGVRAGGAGVVLSGACGGEECDGREGS